MITETVFADDFSFTFVITCHRLLIETSAGRTHEGESKSTALAVVKHFAVEVRVGVVPFLTSVTVKTNFGQNALQRIVFGDRGHRWWIIVRLTFAVVELM